MNRFLQRISFFLLLSLPFLLPYRANAQGISLPASGTYTQTFDNIAGGLPAGWTVRTGAAKSPPQLGVEAALTTAPTPWDDAADGFKNMASADGLSQTATASEQASSGDRALGIRQSATSGDPGAAFTLQLSNTLGVSNLNLKFKIQSLDASATRTTTWRVEYDLGAVPQIYFPLGSSFTTGGTAFSNQDISISLPNLSNNSGPVRLRIISDTPTSGSGNRPVTAIDDVVLTYLTTPNVRVSTLNTLTYSLGDGPATQDFSIEGNFLTGPAALTVVSNSPSVFTVSSDGVNFSPSVIVPYTDASSVLATIKVRLTAGLSIGGHRSLLRVKVSSLDYGYFLAGIVTQTANQPVIAATASLTGTNEFKYSVGGGPIIKSVDLYGANLTGVPGSLTLTSSNPAYQLIGNDNVRRSTATTNYDRSNTGVRFPTIVLIEGLAAGEYSGTVVVEGGGAASVTIPLTGTVTTNNSSGSLSINPTTLAAFSTTQGSPSALQSFTVVGRNFEVNNQLQINVPTGFEGALFNSTNYSQNTLLLGSGTFDIPVTIRMTGLTRGSFNGNVIIKVGTSTITLPVTGAVNPVSTGTQPLSVTVLSYTCQTGALVFGRIGGDPNRVVEYTAVGVKSYSTDPNGIIDLAKRNDPNSGTSVMLKARYVGDAASEVSFNFDFGAYCSGTTPPPVVVPPTPTPGTFAITGVNTIACQVVTAGERRLTFAPTYAGLSGSPVSFSVVRELVPTTNAGPYTLNMYTDNPVITLKAV